MSKPILVLDFDGVIHSYTSGWKGAAVIPDPIVPGFFQFLLDAQQHFDVHVLSSRSHQEGGIPAMMEYLYTEAAKFYRAQGVRTMASYGPPTEEELQRPWPIPIPLHKITDAVDQIKWPTQKPPAMLTIDDRAVCFMGTWPALEDLKTFQPWNKRT